MALQRLPLQAVILVLVALSLPLVSVSEASVSLSQLGFLAIDSSPTGIWVDGDLAFVTAHDYGLWILDVSDPPAPVIISGYPTKVSPRRVEVKDGFAFMTGVGVNVSAVDVSVPSLPVLVGMDSVGYGWTIHIQGDYAYVARLGGPMKIVDISDPSHPLEVSAQGEATWDVALAGSLAFVSTWRGLEVLDISDPTQPDTMSWTPFPYVPYSLAYHDNIVYASARDIGVMVIDVTDPLHPVMPTLTDIGGDDIWDVKVVDQYVYLGGRSGVHVLNLCNPLAPRLVASYPVPGGALSVDVKNNLVYAAGYSSGVYIFSVQESALVPGDVNDDDVVSASDLIFLVNHIFKGGPPACREAARGDLNCDGGVTSSDILFLVDYIFRSGTAPIDCGL